MMEDTGQKKEGSISSILSFEGEGKVRIMPRHRMLWAELQNPENKGIMGKAMRKVGYAHQTSLNPQVVTVTKSWQALLDERLSEELLTRRHNELLNRRDTEVVMKGRGKNRHAEIVDLGCNVAAVKAGLELAYKLRGKLSTEPTTTAPPTPVYNLFYKPQFMDKVKKFENELKEIIASEVRPEENDDTDDIDGNKEPLEEAGA